MVYKPKILIVDDRQENLVALRQVLREVDAEIFEAIDGNKALAMTLSHKFALAILDVQMPGMSGYELAEYLLEDNETKSMPIIFLTAAYADEEHLYLAYEAGGVDYLTKPYSPEVMRAKVNVFLSIDRSKWELEQLRDQLESLVAERTAEWHSLNAELELRVIERTEELAAANSELESFSYSVSHDMRTPLRAIDGYARMLAENHSSSLDEEGMRLLRVISNETARMGKLIEDLLNFSKWNRQKIELEEIDMNLLVQDVFTEQANLTPERAVQLKLTPLASIQADMALMHVVWTNLISNAIKFTRGSNPAIIEIGSRPENEYYVYYVKDNGVGFDMQYAYKLFGVFQRLHSPEEYEGTGVGLGLVERIIHRHGGQAWAKAKVDEGATFYFSLPDTGGTAQ